MPPGLEGVVTALFKNITAARTAGGLTHRRRRRTRTQSVHRSTDSKNNGKGRTPCILEVGAPSIASCLRLQAKGAQEPPQICYQSSNVCSSDRSRRGRLNDLPGGKTGMNARHNGVRYGVARSGRTTARGRKTLHAVPLRARPGGAGNGLLKKERADLKGVVRRAQRQGHTEKEPRGGGGGLGDWKKSTEYWLSADRAGVQSNGANVKRTRHSPRAKNKKGSGAEKKVVTNARGKPRKTPPLYT